MTKKSRQKLKYLENEKSFLGEIKSIFHHFKAHSVAKNYLRPESAPLRYAPLAAISEEMVSIYTFMSKTSKNSKLEKVYISDHLILISLLKHYVHHSFAFP